MRAAALRVTSDSLACASAQRTSRSSTASSASDRAFSAFEALAMAADVACAVVVSADVVPAGFCVAAAASNVACAFASTNFGGRRTIL